MIKLNLIELPTRSILGHILSIILYAIFLIFSILGIYSLLQIPSIASSVRYQISPLTLLAPLLIAYFFLGVFGYWKIPFIPSNKWLQLAIMITIGLLVDLYITIIIGNVSNYIGQLWTVPIWSQNIPFLPLSGYTPSPYEQLTYITSGDLLSAASKMFGQSYTIVFIYSIIAQILRD